MIVWNSQVIHVPGSYNYTRDAKFWNNEWDMRVTYIKMVPGAAIILVHTNNILNVTPSPFFSSVPWHQPFPFDPPW